jgi:NADH-quinone oxidoreductase subunit L
VELAAIILGGPFLAFVLLGVIAPLRRSGRPAAYVSIAGIGTSLAGSIALLLRFQANPEPATWEFLWAPLTRFPSIRFGVLLDGLSVPMLVVVSLVAFLVQIYSLGYMNAERPASLGRYYTFHSLFSMAMLGLVASHNTLQTYFFWELVGLGSYLLIGFWYEKPEASRAAMKAFWTTRLGDVGFALGLIFLWSAGGSFVFAELFERADTGELSGTLLTLGVAGLFLGAMGKSAQFPLHIWLPDAMEGPTPVSALIHAATMVAAGVYLMARISPLLGHTPHVAAWVLTLGTLTAFLAATMALVARDVKRILAFSTISQLGYMMAAVGAGGAIASIFHLTTHAFFKALLFLAAGSVIHAVHTNDIFEMGRLWKKMPITGVYFLVGGLALAGVFPLAGFFSKDEILITLWSGGHSIAFWTLLVTAGLTAFYMFRAFFVVFFGEREFKGHAHESPAVMVGPMGVLAVLAVAGGALGPGIARLLERSISVAGHHEASHAGLAALIPYLGTAGAAFGILVAWLGYQRRAFRPEAIRAAAGPLVTLLERRYFIDEIFVFFYRVLYLGLGAVVGWIDRYVIDGLVNFVSWATWQVAGQLRRVQTGRAQDALYAIAIGFLLLVILAMRG